MHHANGPGLTACGQRTLHNEWTGNWLLVSCTACKATRSRTTSIDSLDWAIARAADVAKTDEVRRAWIIGDALAGLTVPQIRIALDSLGAASPGPRAGRPRHLDFAHAAISGVLARLDAERKERTA